VEVLSPSRERRDDCGGPWARCGQGGHRRSVLLLHRSADASRHDCTRNTGGHIGRGVGAPRPATTIPRSVAAHSRGAMRQSGPVPLTAPDGLAVRGPGGGSRGCGSSRVLKNSLSPRLLKKVQTQGGAPGTHPQDGCPFFSSLLVEHLRQAVPGVLRLAEAEVRRLPITRGSELLSRTLPHGGPEGRHEFLEFPPVQPHASTLPAHVCRHPDTRPFAQCPPLSPPG